MATKYAQPFKGETLNEKTTRIIRGMRFLVKRNPKKYRMVICDNGDTVLEEGYDTIHFRWSDPQDLYRTVTVVSRKRARDFNVTRQIGF